MYRVNSNVIASPPPKSCTRTPQKCFDEGSNFLLYAGIGLIIVCAGIFIATRKRLICDRNYNKCEMYASDILVEDTDPQLKKTFDLDRKDSLDDRLEALTKTLAEKEGQARISKSKLLEARLEMLNCCSGGPGNDVRSRYKTMLNNLKTEMVNNESECKEIQDQIEWISRRRAEVQEELHLGHQLYGEAAAELAKNLSGLRRLKSAMSEDTSCAPAQASPKPHFVRLR